MIRMQVSLYSTFKLSERTLLRIQVHNSLFRGTSVLTRIVVQAMKDYGQDWLDGAIGDPVRELCEGRVEIHLDTNLSVKGLEQAEKAKVEWCDKIWGYIWQAREECPWSASQIISHLIC
jgi:hypothetical protein